MTLPRLGIIAALDRNRIIGIGNRLPWHYSEDLQRFKRLTINSTVIMGRKTWDSIGKPLPNRHNIVLTRNSSLLDTKTLHQKKNKPEYCHDLASAILSANSQNNTIWIIGGADIFAQALEFVHMIDLTYLPEDLVVAGKDCTNAVYFPLLEDSVWLPEEIIINKDNSAIKHQQFSRRQLK